jgi:GTP-binding protein LepA
MVIYDLPLNEVVFDFYDRLKSVSKGYASLRLPDGWTTEEGELVKLSILVNAEPVDALSMHHPPQKPRREPRPAHVREDEGTDPAAHVQVIPIQAAIGGKIVARETDQRAAQGRDWPNATAATHQP